VRTVLDVHVANREEVTAQREMLKGLVKDNALCPQCGKNTHLKLRGVDTHERGWKNNKYMCRRCNIEFVWNRPNNPWDMMSFVEASIADMEASIEGEQDETILTQTREMIGQLQANLDKLKPVIESSDAAWTELQEREKEVERIVHEFKNLLLIEKIKTDTWKG
jgi:hypothetical protein